VAMGCRDLVHRATQSGLRVNFSFVKVMRERIILHRPRSRRQAGFEHTKFLRTIASLQRGLISRVTCAS
jgi:hypothetical protein